MTKSKKNTIVRNVVNILEHMNILVLLEMYKINSDDVNKLRNCLRSHDLNIKVFKNTLVKLSIKDTRNNYLTALEQYLKGQFFFIWNININNDIVDIIKIIRGNFSNLKILCVWHKSKILNHKYIDYISKMPNLCDLQKKILKLILFTINNVIYLLKKSLSSIVNILKSKQIKRV